MRGSEKINLSKSIKEATLGIIPGVAFLRFYDIIQLTILFIL